MSNETSESGFLLLEFSEVRQQQMLYFIAFLMLYMVILSENLLIISAIATDHHLHTPMYFFLMNLAMQDVGSVSVIIPISLFNSLMNTRHISYSGCVAQVFMFIFFLGSDFALLIVMAYDRYIAICNPLHYEMVMNKPACIQMIASVWISGLLYGALHTSSTFAAPFCSNVVNQFFCEIPQLLKLTCSDLYLVELGVLVLSTLLGLGCFIFIIVTYVHIFTAVLRIPTVQGKQKAFSTCLPHLTVFSTYVFTGYFAYLRQPSNTPSYSDLAFTMIYSMVPPLLNPVIYSMRNKEMKNALQRLFYLRGFF
ncbi:olfactory receptor 14C36-like [Hemicordylus capensis]|uniref:olfactory receptor 14C36-like n=1 Tax=Hemicordylus capensis TaxID=884348 RepID=UPI002303C19D|nr:olfactory receptor 14C36-like [Hemicordylus capensis]